jgi:hypothetical protein
MYSLSVQPEKSDSIHKNAIALSLSSSRLRVKTVFYAIVVSDADRGSILEVVDTQSLRRNHCGAKTITP